MRHHLSRAYDGECVVNVHTGVAGLGIRWARYGDWRLLAYADGGYSTNRYVDGPGWVLGENCPEEIERVLCAAMGITYQP